MFRKKLLPLVLALAAAVAITTAAGAAQGPERPKVKANRDTPTVLKDIKEGKAKKLDEQTRMTAVWDGCKFHYLTSDHSDWQFDDGSIAGVSENPEPLPPKDSSCVTTRNPTAAEMEESEARTAELNQQQRRPGAPPLPPLPADRFRGTP